MALVPCTLTSSELDTYKGGHELSENLQEDGRLLRMFVTRGEHLRPTARENAIRNWLIREKFYDEWVGEFAKRYGPPPAKRAPTDAELNAQLAEFIEEYGGVLGKKPAKIGKPHVDNYEETLRQAGSDVHKLRDILLSAMKELRAPKRKGSDQGGLSKMTPEAIAELQMLRQQRLKDVVFACLQGIWASKIGGELLRASLEEVGSLIAKFESKAEDVRDAQAGNSWHKLKALVVDIGEQLPEEMRPKKPGYCVSHEGRGTKTLVELALVEMGGRASTQDIIAWIEDHPQVAEEHSGIKINRRVKNNLKGRQCKVWHTTLRSVLSNYFKKSTKRQNGAYQWSVKKALADSKVVPLADATTSPSEAALPVTEVAIPLTMGTKTAPPAKRLRAAS